MRIWPDLPIAVGVALWALALIALRLDAFWREVRQIRRMRRDPRRSCGR